MTDPGGDVTGNYTALMRERGWNWTDLADDFARQAAQPQLDRGENARRMERWARSQAQAAQERAQAAPAAPDDPRPEPPQRHVVPPATPRRRG